MRASIAARLTCILVLLLLLPGCRDVTAPKGPAQLTVSLATPNTDDGAVLVELTGPGVANLVAASSGYKLYWRLLAPDSARAIVIGDLVQGPLFTAEGTGSQSGFRATILQVARRDDVLRDSVSEYALGLAAR